GGERVEGAESFPLDFTAVEANTDNFLAQVKNLAQSLYTCSSQRVDQDMKLRFLKNVSVTCNDGSPAGYYLRESKGSKRWLLFLEGGWYCFSKQTCDSRFRRTRTLMGSSKWPQTRRGTGILSPQPEENPYWWNANMVLIPYCSSDVWSGTRPKTENRDYAFMGSLIIKEVVNELLMKGLDKARVLLVAGRSAGGIGVLVNVDHIAQQLETQAGGVKVRGLSDSGWVLDRTPYKPSDCQDVLSCSPVDAVKRGLRYWGTIMPEICRQAHVGEEWNCFFGYKIYPTLKSPVFVAQWLFDLAQLMLFNIHLTGQPDGEGQWNYLQSLGHEMRSTLHHVSAMFVPSCVAHELITWTSWMDIQVKGTSLPKALHCWERSLNHNHPINKSPPKRGCPSRVIDSCSWPHCNPTCPKIYDEQTGQEMGMIQFMKHMGFDVTKMAQQQGMDPRTLLSMLSNGS
uniref:Notum, palmitoleoyl-protein carboxylesterase n=1 Tax=Mola mola TaxID=94237 RepID=A0A3Q3WMJ4_MOLML